MVDGLENVIISLHPKGVSLSDIEEEVREGNHPDNSISTISRFTETVANDIIYRQNRPLNSVYLIVRMGSIIVSEVRKNFKAINKTICFADVLNRDSKKSGVGHVTRSERKWRFLAWGIAGYESLGVEDIPITATDNLTK